jgi:DNA-binding transcriptional MerR regulator/effector-binding domain-containing protein
MDVFMKNGKYSIGEISKLCCVPLSRLRYWDEIGIIKPYYVDENNGYRYYDSDVLLEINVLRYYQDCGFKLREIETLMSQRELVRLEPMFDRHIARLDEQMLELSMQRDSIAAWRELIREGNAAKNMADSPISHRWYDSMPLYVSSPYVWEGMKYADLLANVEQCNFLTLNDKIAIGPLYVHFPNGDRNHFSDAKMYIRPHPLLDSADKKEMLPAFGALCTYHKGAFANGYESYRRLEDYAAENVVTLRGDSFERAIIDGWSTRREDEYLLEIILPTMETEPTADMVRDIF